jgi:hypothetical protein
MRRRAVRTKGPGAGTGCDQTRVELVATNEEQRPARDGAACRTRLAAGWAQRATGGVGAVKAAAGDRL